jgi:hypothetical protein
MTDARDDRLRALYAAGVAAESLASHPEPEAIAAAVERRGPETERLRTLGHITACPQCRRDFDLLRSAHHAGRDLVARTWWVRAGAVAAAAVLIMAIGLTVRFRAPTPIDRSITRGGAAQLIDLVEPPRGALTTVAPELMWRAVPGAGSYRVEVLDGTGAVIARRDTPDTVLAAPSLRPGRTYRWWVRTMANGLPWHSVFGEFTTRP